MQSGNQRDEDVAGTLSSGKAGPPGVLQAEAVGAPEAPAQMARFYFPDDVTLEIHIPKATGVGAGESAATEAGFILRRGKEILNVGPLGRILRR